MQPTKSKSLKVFNYKVSLKEKNTNDILKKSYLLICENRFRHNLTKILNNKGYVCLSINQKNKSANKSSIVDKRDLKC